VDSYPSLISTNIGILLFTIRKHRYDAGIVSGTFALSAHHDLSSWFTLSSSVTSSTFGSNIDVFPNPLFRADSGEYLDSSGVSGFLFNDEGILGLVSSSANDSSGYNSLSAFGPSWGISTFDPPKGEASGVASFISNVNINTLNIACKIKPNEFNYSFNPSAFSTTAEGGSSSFGYLYDYRFPITDADDSTDIVLGDTTITYDESGSEMTSSSTVPIPAAGEFQAYVTTVGLYDDDNDLLAIAKLGQPLRRSSTVPTTFKVQLDL